MKQNTRELPLCICVFTSIPLPNPPRCVRTHGESSLRGKSSYQNLTLLAPWSGTSRPQNCKEINFCCLFHWVYCILLWHSWLTNTKIIYFKNLQKKMNERKLKKLLHLLGIFEISQNWSFLCSPHLMSWWLLWPRDCVIWSLADAAFLLKGHYSPTLMQRVHLGGWRATHRGVARVGHDLATKPPPHSTYKLMEHCSGMLKDVVRQPGGIE